MTTGSNLVEVQSALVSGLAARAGLANVKVSYNIPQTELSNESIWFGDAECSLDMPVHRGGSIQKMEESITLFGTVQVLATQGRSQQMADDRAVEILAELQQHLAEKPQVTDNIMWAIFQGWKKTGGVLPTSKGHATTFDFRIEVKARLYPFP